MYGTARVNFGDGWVEDCDFLAGFQDGGEPEEDGVGIAVTCEGDLTYEVDYLSGGNIQLHDGTKD
jgi:hypothetical protein